MKNIISLIFIFITNFVSFAQVNIPILENDLQKENPKNYKKAIKLIIDGDKNFEFKKDLAYQYALEYYLDAYKLVPENTALNYKIGTCYLYTTEKNKALSFLQKAFDANPKISPDIQFLLGKAFQTEGLFYEAQSHFAQYKKKLTNRDKFTTEPIVNKHLLECENGMKYVANPVDVEIEDLEVINSSYPDYSPLITADESMMIFTSRRENSTGKRKDPTDNGFYEDIYISFNTNNKWSAAENIGKPLNTVEHDATVGLSADGTSIFIYYRGDIYQSSLDGNTWTEPKPLPATINSPEVETSACLSSDGNTLYFVRGKAVEGGKANRDIYQSKRKNKTWLRAQKLSEVINTPYDEDGVFIHPDGKTLYFSSKGHSSMGGFDVFKSVLQADGTWSKPENLGYPINTANDDIYFVLSASGKHGYISALRTEGSKSMDIFRITFKNIGDLVVQTSSEQDSMKTKEIIKIAPENTNSSQLTLVKGRIFDASNNKAIIAEINIMDNDKNEIVATTQANSTTGNFLVSLPSGKNYGMVIKSESYLFYSENFDLTNKDGYQEIATEIPMVDVSKDAKIVLNNIFYETASAKLNETSIPELQQIINLMKSYPSIKVEISGHTDNTGDYQTNIKLSEERAKSVVSYLTLNGISNSRLQYKGYAYQQPIASNNTETGRAKNRRVEFKIISK